RVRGKGFSGVPRAASRATGGGAFACAGGGTQWVDFPRHGSRTMSHSWKLNTFGAGIRCRLRKPDAAQRFIRRGTDRFFTQVIELYPAELYAFALAEVPSTAEAVFFGGNDFRATGMIAALEEDLGRPV